MRDDRDGDVITAYYDEGLADHISQVLNDLTGSCFSVTRSMDADPKKPKSIWEVRGSRRFLDLCKTLNAAYQTEEDYSRIVSLVSGTGQTE